MERLHMHQIRDLVYRLRHGEGDRKIARDMAISRHTVAKYRELAQAAGYLEGQDVLPTEQELLARLGPAKSPPRIESTVEPYREVVEQLLSQGVEMMAMFARLQKDHGYSGSYSSIRRFVHRIEASKPEAFVRVHTPPGEEAQVDFGAVGPLLDPVTRVRRLAYAFVMTLGFSRHHYAELVFDQKVSTWIACHRHAFESFGGVPRRIVPDNLKAAMLSAALDEPVLGEPYRRMAQHYGCLISPTRPRTPEHKGKVESGVHYVERNFMAGQEFADIVVANRELRVWTVEVAGTRQHGTTGKQPLKVFNEVEKAVLLPLPAEPFTLVEIRSVKLHSDCHVTIDGSYYSGPYQHVGKQLEAHVGERVVELYLGVELLCTHERAKDKGEWHTRNEHYPPEKMVYLERTPERCCELAREIGPETAKVVESLLAERPLDRLRGAQGVLRLAEKFGQQRIEAACRRALHFGDPRYRRIKDILNAGLDQEPLPALPTPLHPTREYAFARTAEEFFGNDEAVAEAQA